jgi:hypothetical protein
MGRPKGILCGNAITRLREVQVFFIGTLCGAYTAILDDCRPTARFPNATCADKRCRLTLNVPLSFAQFEREVTSERIRDKIGASKRKGLWVGGMVPLGYVSRDRKLFVEQEEAERVHTIFRRYLELGSIGLLLAHLRERGIVTKVRHLSDGRTIGGIPFTSSLSDLTANPLILLKWYYFLEAKLLSLFKGLKISMMPSPAGC